MSIIVDKLSKTFETQKAVNQISFEVPSGTIVGFLGPNGAGKSTTMKMLTTYIPPTSGTAKIYGLDIVEQAMEVRKIVGYLPESNPLYFDLYVREYLEIAAGIYNIKNKKSRIDEVIEMTGLNKEITKKIGNLSKGYKQRVGLAQALIHDPKVLILDEPTSGLDPNQLADIRELIINIGKDKTILLSTHIMQEVEAMCQKVIIIKSGHIVANDSLEALQAADTNETATSTIVVDFESPITLAAFNFPVAVTLKAIGSNSLEVQTTATQEARKYIMQWSMSAQNDIINIQTNQKNLEDTFRALTK